MAHMPTGFPPREFQNNLLYINHIVGRRAAIPAHILRNQSKESDQ